MDYNYFEVLELSIDDIQDKDEATIKKRVNDAHTKLYALTIGAYANVPRSDGLTQAQWQKVLNDAKATLLDPRKRQKHIADLMPEPEPTQAPETTEIPEPEPTQAPETTEIPEPKSTQAPEREWRKWIALSIVQSLIAIILWSWVYHVVSTRDLEGILLTLLFTIGVPLFSGFFYDDGILDLIRTLKLEELKPELVLGSIIILVLPWVCVIESVLFEVDFPYVSLFLNPSFILLAFLDRVGFIKYCWYVSYDIVGDYYIWASIKFLGECVCYVRYRYRSLIAIFAGTLAGGLAFYGIRTDFFSELFKLGFVSSVTSIDFVLFYFLIDCLKSLYVITTFVRAVVYRRLGLMIKRLIMIGIVILAPFLTITLSDMFSLGMDGNFLSLLPAALIIIFYYTVGYIRYTRYLVK